MTCTNSHLFAAEPSLQFFEFLSLLGDRVALNGFEGYTGGLDVTRKSRALFIH
jgi:hypothetical protein